MSHIPFASNNNGKIKAAITKKTKDFVNARSADIFPFSKAVKKAEPKILIPTNKKLTEKYFNPITAILNTGMLLSVNIPTSGSAAVMPIIKVNNEEMRINFLVKFKIFIMFILLLAP